MSCETGCYLESIMEDAEDERVEVLTCRREHYECACWEEAEDR